MSIVPVSSEKETAYNNTDNSKMDVLNLSNYKLNDSEITLLAKGLKFTTSQ